MKGLVIREVAAKDWFCISVKHIGIKNSALFHKAEADGPASVLPPVLPDCLLHTTKCPCNSFAAQSK